LPQLNLHHLAVVGHVVKGMRIVVPVVMLQMECVARETKLVVQIRNTELSAALKRLLFVVLQILLMAYLRVVAHVGWFAAMEVRTTTAVAILQSSFPRTNTNMA